MSIAFKPRRMVLHIHNVAYTHFLFHCSYSRYEPKVIVLSEHKGGLEKAILKNSTLLVQLISAHAAVSKVSVDECLKRY